MKKMVAVCLFASLLLVAVSLALADDQEATVVLLVDKAVASFQEKGKDYTIKLLNASGGPFRKGSLYVFAVDFNGLALAHAANKKFRGSDVFNLKDAKGKYVIQEFIKVAKEKGSGWVDYWWNRTGEKQPTLKRSYVRKVPGEEMFLGCGYYVE